jgi:hypothetical protein
MDLLVAVATGFSGLNVVLLVALLFIYFRIASKMHAGYTYGLMIFSGLLLGQNSLMVYICGFLTGFYNWQLDPFLAGLAVLESVGILALLKVTL